MLMFPEKIVLPHSEEVFAMRSEKMKAKYMKEDVRKRFFCKPASWHLATSSQIIFKDFK